MADSSVLALRRSPLHRHRHEIAAGGRDAVRLREVPFLAQIGLRARPGSAAATALEEHLGLPLPTGVQEVTGDPTGEGVAVLWLGPDEFLAIAEDEAQGGPDPVAWAADLAALIVGMPGQVLDLSANRTTLELSGEHAQDVLDSAVRIDLDPCALPAGSAVATLLGGVPVLLWRTRPECFRVMPRSSFAVHVARWLLDAMREF